MVTTLLKSTLREIRQSLGRYLAIFAIILLGVGVYGGLKMSQPDMMATGKQYIDEQRLFDFRLLSTLGFTDEDVAAFAEMENVESARGAVYADFITNWSEEQELVFTALSLTEGINEPSLIAGWLPKNSSECLGDARFFSEADLGKQVTVSPSNKEDTLDLLCHDSYTLVGIVQSPYYLSSVDRGTSSIGGGTVSAFVYIPEDGFEFEAYYEIFLKLHNTAESYSDAYKEQIDAVKAAVEALTEERADLRYETIYGDAMEELRDAEQELADGWDEYNSEKSDVKQELADAYEELTEGELDYQDGLLEVADGWVEYEDGLKEYEDGLRELQDAKTELQDAKAELDDAKAELLDAEAELLDAKVKLDDAKAELDDAKAELDDAKATLAGAKAELDDGESGYTDLKTLYDSAVQLAAATRTGTPAQLIAALKSGSTPQLNTMVDQALKAQGSSVEEFVGGWTAAEASIGTELNESYLAGLRATLDAGRADYEAGLAEYEDGLRQYEDGLAEYKDGYAEYEDGNAKYKDGYAAYVDGLRQYEDGLQEYQDGERKLRDAKIELDDAKQTLLDAEQELADARVELDDGWKEYEDGMAEADEEFRDAEEELHDAEIEIADAYEELNDLEEADTYVLTREENAGYVSFENDTSIVAAVAVVFPVFFFLVAALVCVTTMTRMVDEQRTQIGVLKAMGYSNAQIMGKYIFYSGSAATMGTVAGFAIGSTAMPWIIWQIYGIMYDFAPLTFLFDPALAALTFAAAMLCSAGSTWCALRMELKEAAAELIRPKTPKAGRRVFLEYITPIWKRLSFLHKVSVRNVLRYRSRLIMMVLGIGGCTALLITGFGLKDSLTSVIDEQFEKITFFDFSVNFREEPSADEVDAYLADKGWDTGLLIHTSSSDIVTDNGTRSAFLVISSEAQVDGYLSLYNKDGAIAYPGPGEAVLNEGLAEKLSIQVGDEIQLRRDNGKMLSATVSAICDNYVNNYIYLHEATYEQQMGEKPDYLTLWLHEREGFDPYADGALLSDCEDVQQVTVNAATRDQVVRMLGRLDLLVVVVVVCAGALAFIVLYNLTNINITERIREIATIKVLGFFRGEAAAYVFREINLLAVLGSFAGLFMGKALHAFVMAQVSIDAVYFPTLVKPISYAYAVGLTILFTQLISLVMRPRIAKIHMAESLKSVE